MSDPVTNVEIEDVLSSIRRLVAEGDRVRKPLDIRQEPSVVEPRQAERFVLTPALRIAEEPENIAENDVDTDDEAENWVAEIVAAPAEPLVLEPAAMLSEPKVHDKMTDLERASLEATIAELEAAVTYQPDEWEPDGSESSQVSGLAAAFAAMTEEDIEAADVVEAVVQERVVPLRPQTEPTFRHTPPSAIPDDDATDYGDDLRDDDVDDGMPIPDDLDETLAAYIAGGSELDRDEIRQLVVDVVRQELQGELGERITRNVRKLVRREIQRAATANLYD